MSYSRKIYLLGLSLCTVSLLVAFGLEHIFHMEPCPLCMLSRLMVMVVGIAFAISAIHNPKKIGIKIYACIGVLLSLIGVALNSRHIWLQQLPPEKAPACGPGLDYLLQIFTPLQVLKEVLMGSGECAKVDGSFLGLSLPMWTLGLFIIFCMIWILSCKKKG